MWYIHSSVIMCFNHGIKSIPSRQSKARPHQRFVMANTHLSSDSIKQSTPLDQLRTIFYLQQLFGLHPYEVQISGSNAFKLVVLPIGFTLYLAHGVLFVYCLICHYQITSTVGAIASTPMAHAQEIVTVSIHIVMYIFCFVGMTVNLRLLNKLCHLFPVMKENFDRIGIRRPKTIRMSSAKKTAMVWYCFSELLMFFYYLYFKQPTVQEWLPDYSLHLVPTLSLQCSIWSYMMYVGLLKAFQDQLNEALEMVARSEVTGPVKLAWTSNYVI